MGDYNACEYSGFFAYAPDEQKSFDWVRDNNIVAFFTDHGNNSKYGNKRIRLKAAGKEIEALIIDTCRDSDCPEVSDGCCSHNAQPSGYLVDMEYWTVMNNFGNVEVVDGQICWQLVD